MPAVQDRLQSVTATLKQRGQTVRLAIPSRTVHTQQQHQPKGRSYGESPMDNDKPFHCVHHTTAYDCKHFTTPTGRRVLIRHKRIQQPSDFTRQRDRHYQRHYLTIIDLHFRQFTQTRALIYSRIVYVYDYTPCNIHLTATHRVVLQLVTTYDTHVVRNENKNHSNFQRNVISYVHVMSTFQHDTILGPATFFLT